MAGEKMTVSFGLMSFVTKRETARVTVPTVSYLCVGQPGHPAHEASPRRAPYHCDVCGPIIDNDVLVRGVKTGKTYTLVDVTAAQELRAEYADKYDSLSLVPHPAADFLAQTGEGRALHYLTPADAGQADHYALLAQLIQSHPELAFVGLYTPRSATSLFHLTVRDGVILMAERTRTDSLKPMPSVGGEVNEKLYGMLDSMLDQFTEPYDAERYEDTYATTLADLIDNGEVLAIDTTTKKPVKAMTDDELMAKLAELKPAKKKAPARKKAS